MGSNNPGKGESDFDSNLNKLCNKALYMSPVSPVFVVTVITSGEQEQQRLNSRPGNPEPYPLH